MAILLIIVGIILLLFLVMLFRTLQLGEPPYQNANVELPEVDASRAAAHLAKLSV